MKGTWAELGQVVAERVKFNLSYKRAPRVRRFYDWGIDGENIACAYRRDRRQVSEWHHDFPEVATEQQWIASFFEAAVSEAIHEALEWFKVDGNTALDPHGKNQDAIMEMSAKFAQKLWRLRLES